jgi:hypothetical protein
MSQVSLACEMGYVTFRVESLRLTKHAGRDGRMVSDVHCKNMKGIFEDDDRKDD